MERLSQSSGLHLVAPLAPEVSGALGAVVLAEEGFVEEEDQEVVS